MTKSPARIHSAELEGIKARLIEIEVDLHVGLHSFSIVGLADKALNEAKERVSSALKNSGAKPPNRENRKITVSLAPADVKKTGSQYDLGIAIGYLLATEQMQAFNAKNKMFVGELALDGRLRPINGALNISEMAKRLGFEFLLLPAQNANEAAVIEGISVIPLETLQDAMDFLEGRRDIKPWTAEQMPTEEIIAPDFSEIKGQENAKRAMTIAAAGGHNLLMTGPPGVGKSLLSQAMIGILPDITLDEAIEVTKIYSSAGLGSGGLIRQRPFRSPHHTASAPAVVGGGGDPKPGEISLAHRGILFLDELPEFPKNILEALRQPLESGSVNISRAKTSLSFPARFTLVAAMNPCPCGFAGDTERECRCAAYDGIRYQRTISGPLLDRIALQIKVLRVALPELRKKKAAELVSPAIKKRVETAREWQRERFKHVPTQKRPTTNSEMSSKQVEELGQMTAPAETFLETFNKSTLSPRGYYRLLKTARTIADLENAERISEKHLAEAFSYRLREES